MKRDTSESIYIGLAAVAISHYPGRVDDAKRLINNSTNYFIGKMVPIEAARILATGAFQHQHSPELLNPFLAAYRDLMKNDGMDPVTAATIARETPKIPYGRHKSVISHVNHLRQSLTSRIHS